MVNTMVNAMINAMVNEMVNEMVKKWQVNEVGNAMVNDNIFHVSVSDRSSFVQIFQHNNKLSSMREQPCIALSEISLSKTCLFQVRLSKVRLYFRL